MIRMRCRQGTATVCTTRTSPLKKSDPGEDDGFAHGETQAGEAKGRGAS